MRARQTGMSIIEMMVAVAIGLIGIVIIMQAYLTGENFNRTTLGAGGTQTNGLMTLYTIEREMRTAGYGINSLTALGCGNLRWHYSGQYSANVAGGTLPNVTIAPVVITVDPLSTATPDQVAILYSSKNERMLPATLLTFSSGTRSATVDGLAGFATGDYLVLAATAGCSLIRITGTVSASSTIQFATTDPHNPSTWSPGYPNYIPNDLVINLGDPAYRTYYIENGKLRMNAVRLQQGALAPVDIVDNVVDMRAVYAKDNGASGGTANDGNVDEYSNVQPTTPTEWQQVIGVKVGVLVRNSNYEKPDSGTSCTATTVRPTWSQGTFRAPAVTDPASQDRCYRYQVFETTIPLRNMIWRPT
jgi:type IV pilus assembly protein PilW